jgi:very-short-patch-repair endonuclease
MPRTYIRRSGDRRPQDGPRSNKVYVPKWVDPYFTIQGSSIEKMVMAELIRRGIYFEHTPQTNTLQWQSWMFENGKNPTKWEPDFLFPQYRIWMEIQGAYFHTLPGQVETDALRFAYIQTIGWKPVFWWEDDIRNRLQDLFNAVPEFYRVDRALNDKLIGTRRTTPGLPFYEGGTGIDHLAGLRSALRHRGRPPQHLIKRYAKKRRPK